jgi:multidrug efflux pump subunit AcrA (membrane-fusion protein)
MHRRRWVAVGAVVVAVGVVAVLVVRGTRGSAAGPVRYLTAVVRRGAVAQTVSATGTVQPARLLDLSFGSSGTVSSDATAASGSGASTGSTGESGGGGGGGGQSVVTAVYVKVGDRVHAGDPLAHLDAGDAQQQLTVADAQLAAAQAKAALPAGSSSSAAGASSPSATSSSSAAGASSPSASTSSATPIAAVARATPTPAARRPARTPAPAAQRAPTATPTPSAAQQAATDAENNLSVAQAESAVHSAQEAVAATVLRAPVSGRVVAVNLIKGVAPPSGTAVEERSGTLQVQADVAEQDIASVRRGQRADVTLPALGATESAVVTGMPTQASSNASSEAGASTVVTFPVTLTLRRPGRAVLPGMSAQVALDVQRHAHVLYVPTTAIQGPSTAPSVQVLDDGRAISRPVETGLSTDTSTEIVVGLRVGEVVVTGVVNPVATATVSGAGFGGLGGGAGGLRGAGGGGFGGGGFRRSVGGATGP